MPKCVICGAEFDFEYVSPKNSTAKFPREICKECSSPKMKPAVRREANNNINNYCELAGAVERLVLNEYRHLYHEVLRTMSHYSEFDVITDNEISFLSCHKQVTGRELLYHDAMTFGNFLGLLDAARREEEKKFPDLMQSGYDVFERGLMYGEFRQRRG